MRQSLWLFGENLSDANYVLLESHVASNQSRCRMTGG